MAFFITTRQIISEIDDFFDAVDHGTIVFKDGVENYLSGNTSKFTENIQNIKKIEEKADGLRRKVENDLYEHSLLPQYRGDILRLMEKCDDLLDIAKGNLYQFEVEIPRIPKKIHNDLIKLTEVVVASVDALVPACRAFFKDVSGVRDMIHRVYFYEKEADKLANDIKRKIFHDMENLSLSEKFHLRYFTLHIENLSDAAETVADILSIMAIKRIV